MTDRTALRKLGETAEKWRDLAEKRRAHFSDLYRSGRWRLFYDEEQFITRMRDIARICDRWAQIVETAPAAEPEPADLPVRRNAA